MAEKKINGFVWGEIFISCGVEKQPYGPTGVLGCTLVPSTQGVPLSTLKPPQWDSRSQWERENEKFEQNMFPYFPTNY